MQPATQPTPRRSTIAVQLLRPLAVTVNGTPMPEHAWRLRHPRQLFQMLCLRGGHRLHRDEAVEALWPQAAARASSNRLYHTIHVLRAEFAKMGLSEREPVLLFQSGSLWLNPHHEFVVDALRFDEFVDACRAADAGESADALFEEAASLCGHPLEGVDSQHDGFELRRKEIRDKSSWLLEQLASRHRAAGREAQAVQVLQRLTELEPCNETAHRSLMQLFDAAAQPARAMLQYSACRRFLQRDLGAQPSAETNALRDAIAARSAPRVQADAEREGDARHAAFAVPVPLPGALLGRSDELVELRARLIDDRCRLVTIAAPAGTGKTSLALVLAHAVQAQFRDGVLVVRLTALADAAGLQQCVAQAAGVSPGPAAITQALREHFADKHLLLVLDRFEHVVDAAADVAGLLEAAPALQVLVTSQCTLNCEAEHVYALRQLADASPAAALELFERTARGAGAAAPHLASPQQVSALCERLGGNALAIKLAAAQLASLAMHEVLEGIVKPLDFAPARNAADEPQHRSLRAAIGWSLSLLSAGAREVLQGLAVFKGEFSLDDARAVLGDLFGAEATREAVHALLQRHLVHHQQTPARSERPASLVLPDAIQQLLLSHSHGFALWPAVQASHAQVFRQRTADAMALTRVGDHAGADMMFGRDRRNIERALQARLWQGDLAADLQWTYEIGVLELTRGGLFEVIGRTRHAVSIGPRSSEEHRQSAWCCYLLARALAYANDMTGSVYVLRLGRQRSEGSSDAHLAEMIGMHFAHLRSSQLHFRAASLHVDGVIRRTRASGSRADTLALFAGSAISMLRGDYGPALEMCRAASDAALQTDNLYMAWLSRLQLLEIELRKGLLDCAFERAEECRQLESAGFGSLPLFFAELVHFALCFESADYAAAQVRLGTARDLAGAARSPCTDLVVFAEELILCETGRETAVDAMLSNDVSNSQFHADAGDICVQFQCGRLRLQAQRGLRAEALVTLDLVLRLIRRSGNRLWASWLVGALAGVAADRREAAVALALLRQAEALQRGAGVVPSPRQSSSWRRVRDLVSAHGGAVETPRGLSTASPSFASTVDAWQRLAETVLFARDTPRSTEVRPRRAQERVTPR
jgi:DNA-binding SARP family transcriptional activator